MAVAVEEDFESWLSCKLKALNTDEGVFGSYITGILDGEETLEEKNEALEGILVDITEDISKHCQEILDKWQNFKGTKNAAQAATSAINVEDRLAQLLEPTTKDLVVQKEYTEEEKKIREAILAQYAQTSDHEDDYEDEVEATRGAEASGPALYKNLNAATVAQAEKEKREQAKIDSALKKEKDKADSPNPTSEIQPVL
ncbi:hypothetical protein M8J77_015005 [Diaphorina citri]|nr:hypothetical protein M8J77_015005 [Diaphorina citri]